MNTVDKETPSSASGTVKRYTHLRRRSGRAKIVGFRLPFEVYVLLRECVPNISGFLRKLVFDSLEKLTVVFEFEELGLELEISRLNEELEKVHRWQKLLLKHGSYAEAYLEKLKGGHVIDRKPFYVPQPLPSIHQW